SALAGVGAAADSDEGLLLVVDVHVHEGHGAAGAPDARCPRQHAADGRAEVVDPEVDRRHAAADRHADGVVANRVEEARERAAVKLPSALPPLQLGPHRHADRERAGLVVERDNLEAEEAQERRGVESGLYLLGREFLGALAHGLTTTLPMTRRSSKRRNASFTSASGSSRSMTGTSCPCRIRVRSAARSSRIHPFDPSTLSSNVQMKRRSSLGSKPAVAPQVSTLPWRCRTLSDGTHVSPPVKLTTTSTPPVNFRRCGLPKVSCTHFTKSCLV